jgi:transcriptional regulator with XRE-family HTH domain
MPSAARRSPLYGRAEEVRRLITEEGFTLPAIGERYGMSIPAVRAFCKRNEIKERAPCGRPTPLKLPTVQQQLAKGMTMAEIGAAVGVTKGAVSAFCSRNGLTVARPQGRNLKAVAERGSGRTTQRKLDRGFDGRALGNAGAGNRRTARQQDALEARKLKDLGAIVANCKTGGTLPALTAEERVAKKEQIQSDMAGLLRAAEDYVAALGAGVKLRDVREGQCRYPLWPEGSDDHRVCGRPVAGERAYCASCAQRTLYYVAPDLRAPRDPNVIRRKW